MTSSMAKFEQNVKFYSHPKHQQDKWVICEVFGGKQNGFFVDVGADDGIGSSNSYALETQFNWQGICVEANPDRYDKLKKNRSCYVECVALWDELTELTFVVNLDLPGTSGVPDETIESQRNLFYKETTQTRAIKVKATPLVDLLGKYNAPKYIDYLSIDIEGAEYRALENFPFDEYTFGCMTIEKGSKKLLKLRQLLLSQGYRLVKVKGADDFWVHPSVKYRLPFDKQLGVAARKWVQTIRSVIRGEW